MLSDALIEGLRMTGRVAGKVALITGGARGLGEADAVLLAGEGATVVVTDILDGSAVAEATGGRYLPHDVTDEAAWEAVIRTVRELYGRLDILVNNAGIAMLGDIETGSLHDYRRVNAVSAEGTFLGCKHALPLMREDGNGSIINMSSLAAIRSFPSAIAYGAAKSAVRCMTGAIARHCLDEGYPVRCNAIFPAAMDTPMIRDAAAGRRSNGMGQPVDVANMVLYLASDESRFVTGSEFVIDNGYCTR